MITPKKHMNLDASVLRVAALIMKEVAKRRVLNVEKLRKRLSPRVGNDIDLVFLPALSFLYLMGKISYYPKNDTLEYVDG